MHYSFLMLAMRTNITEDKTVLRYERSGDRLYLLSFFNSVGSINFPLLKEIF
jgi:hypothetical protein